MKKYMLIILQQNHYRTFFTDDLEEARLRQSNEETFDASTYCELYKRSKVGYKIMWPGPQKA